MSIIAALHRWVRSPRAQDTINFGTSSAEAIREFLRWGHGGDTAAGIPVGDTAVMKVAAAWRCINIIAGTIASMPLDVIVRKGEHERHPARGHPLRRVLTTKPNSWQSPSDFRRLLQAHLMLRGNAYALKVMAGSDVVGLIPIHPDAVQVEQLPDLTIRYTITKVSGEVVVKTQREVLHLRGLSLDGVTGLSVLAHMRESIGLALAGEQAGAKLMRHGSFATGVVKHPGRLGKEGFENLRSSWEAHNAGSRNAGRPLILEEGMEYAPLALSAADAEFLGLRDFQRYDIAMFFGVPPHMIGATEKTTSWGSGIEAQGIAFVTYTLTDWMRIWEEALKRDCLPDRQWETHDIRFYTQGLLRGDVKTRGDYYTRLLQWGVVSPDEVRAFEDMNPRRDGKGGVYYEPPNTSGSAGHLVTGDDPSTGEESDEPREAADPEFA